MVSGLCHFCQPHMDVSDKAKSVSNCTMFWQTYFMTFYCDLGAQVMCQQLHVDVYIQVS